MTFTLLLIDDNFDHRFLARRALREWEAQGAVRVVVAEEGESALAALADGLAPDLILLDIKMPRMDGFEVLAQVRGMPRLVGTPIVMLTSSENRSDIERARAMGAHDYVIKSMDAREFQDTIQACVRTWMDRKG